VTRRKLLPVKSRGSGPLKRADILPHWSARGNHDLFGRVWDRQSKFLFCHSKGGYGDPGGAKL